MGKTWGERIEAMARESWNRGRLEPEIVWDDLDGSAQEFYLQEARRDAEAFCDGGRLYQINRQRAQELSESDSLFCLIQDGVLVPLRKETDDAH